MSPIVALLIGFLFGFLLRGWFRKSSDNTYPYHTYTDSIDVDKDFACCSPEHDIPKYFGRPIKLENTEPDFEQIWLGENKYKDYLCSKRLSDDDYIRYHQWENEHSKEMYEKHLPNHIVFSGRTGDKLVFHGGCLRCNSQEVYGINRCKGCSYFKFNHSLPDLSTNN
jgi:hypothetical protein